MKTPRKTLYKYVATYFNGILLSRRTSRADTMATEHRACNGGKDLQNSSNNGTNVHSVTNHRLWAKRNINLTMKKTRTVLKAWHAVFTLFILHKLMDMLKR